ARRSGLEPSFPGFTYRAEANRISAGGSGPGPNHRKAADAAINTRYSFRAPFHLGVDNLAPDRGVAILGGEPAFLLVSCWAGNRSPHESGLAGKIAGPTSLRTVPA